MKKRVLIATIGLVITTVTINSCIKEQQSANITIDMVVSLGQKLFFDQSLSNPGGQSCASCHAAVTAFSDPYHNIVSPGIAGGLAGNRNGPAIAYSRFSVSRYYSIEDSSYKGGLFWDGRVNTLEEQAQKPFLNPLEMGNTDAAMVVRKLQTSPNYAYYKQIYGDATDVDKTFANIATAIATFERSDTFGQFTSKFDYYLKGQAVLTDQEYRGMKLFSDTLRAMCSNCHSITPDETYNKILFSDHTYENIGVPRNRNNPFYGIPLSYNPDGVNYIDLGLGAIINDSDFYGTFKVPTLRNVAISAPYFHNGVFGTLEQVVHFYNTRDSTGAGFESPEYAPTIDHTETGNQHLSAQEEKDIVAFLKTLTDGYYQNQ